MSVTLRGKLEFSRVFTGRLLENFDKLTAKEALLQLKQYEEELHTMAKTGLHFKSDVDITVTAWVDDDRNRVKKKSHFDKILELVREDIKEAERQDVKGLSPRLQKLKHDLGLIECGMSRAIPYEWDKRYSKQLDNEWEEYKRLHEKFSGERL